MSSKRKSKSEPQASEAQGKLSRLIETEQELDAMITETRKRAAALLESAKSQADERIRRCDLQLEAADRALRDEVAAQRDQAVASIREAAQREAASLEELDETSVTELARHVVQLLVEGLESGGQS